MGTFECTCKTGFTKELVVSGGLWWSLEDSGGQSPGRCVDINECNQKVDTVNPQQEIWYNLYIGLFSQALDVISTNGLLLRVPEVYARSPPKNQSWWCMNSRRL